MVVLVDQAGGKVLGLVTLHDVLRAQTAMAKDNEP
jgi:CBS domain-containing protein